MNRTNNSQNGFSFLFSSKLFHVGLISVVCVLIYWPSLHSYFVGSDFHMIPLSVYDGWESFSKIFWGDNIYRAQGEGGYYRPIYILSFTLDYFLWKLNPFGYHLTNIIVHVLCSILLYIIASYLIPNRFFALIAGIIFSLHPIHVEAVAYISPRVSSIATLFYLISFTMYIKYTYKKSYLILGISLMSFVIALATKEIAATLPLIVISYNMLFLRKNEGIFKIDKKFIKYAAPFIIILFSYLIFRFLILGRVVGIVTDRVIENTPLQIDIVSDVFHFFQHTFPLSFPIEFNLKSVLILWEYKYIYYGISILWFALIIFIIIKYFLSSKLFTFSILWMFITFLVVHQFGVDLFNFWGSRFIYLPSVGFCILLSSIFYNIHKYCVDRGYRIRKAITVSHLFIALILVLYALLTVGKIERIKNGGDLAKNIVYETAKYLPPKLDNAVIYFICLPSHLHGALVYGPIDKAFHFFNDLYTNVEIVRFLQIRSKGETDPDIRINFLNENSFTIDIIGLSPLEYLYYPSDLGYMGGRSENEFADLTNLMVDKELLVTRLQVDLKSQLNKEYHDKYYFYYKNGHIYSIENKYVNS